MLGPTTLELELRAVIHEGAPQPSEARVRVESLGSPGSAPGPAPSPAQAETTTLALASTREPAVVRERRRQFEVSHATSHRIVLAESGAHRITVTSDVGRLLVRAQRRRDRADLPPPSPLASEPARGASGVTEPIPWLPLRLPTPSAGRAALVAHEPIAPIRNRVGTLDLRVRAGLDQIADVDDLDPRMGLITNIGWRRALLDHNLWLAITGEARLREQSAPAAGGSLSFAARLPPLGVRLGAALELLAEPFAGRTETSVRLYTFIDCPISDRPLPAAAPRPGHRAALAVARPGPSRGRDRSARAQPPRVPALHPRSPRGRPARARAARVPDAGPRGVHRHPSHPQQ